MVEPDTASPVSDVGRLLESGIDPHELREPLSPADAVTFKNEAAALVLGWIGRVIEDHEITPAEMSQVRHIQRILRIEEGDLLATHPNVVRDLLCEELKRLLEDRAIDPAESLHKVKLQELFGLGYDQFLDLTKETVGEVIVHIASQIDHSRWGSVGEFRKRVAALDTVFDLNPAGGGSRRGYVYLLANPSMPGVVKVGRTTKEPSERVSELSSATGVPTPFDLIYYVATSDCFDAEKRTHEWLTERGYRVSSNREFFNAPIPDVIAWMNTL